MSMVFPAEKTEKLQIILVRGIQVDRENRFLYIHSRYPAQYP